jgi:hypothetical protein
MNGGFKGFSAKHAVSGLVLPNPDPEYIGSTMLFIQATAPTGWVKETGNNDCALRVTTGTPTTGGTNGFTTCFPGASRAVSATAPAISASAGAATLSSTQIPSHTHPYNTRSPIGVTYSSSLSVSPLQARYTVLTSGQPGNIGSGGTGGSHSHIMPASPVSIVGTSLALSLKYLDAIFATRSNPTVAPTVTYDWYTFPATGELGTPVTWRVVADSATEGTTLYWSIEHISTSPADFSATEGSFTINDTFVGAFTITTLADGVPEGNEQYKINVRTGSQLGPVVLTTTVTIVGDLPPPQSQQAFITSGIYSWTAPAGVTSVSVVAVGPGGQGYGITMPNQGGGGGGLGWKNNISVIPGQSYTVVVGAAGSGVDSSFSSLVKGGAGANATSDGGGAGGTYTGDGGGNGGQGGTSSAGNASAGGGAGGYAGNGGAGGGQLSQAYPHAGVNGAGGGGGGGGLGLPGSGGGGGGGVGIFGQGADGLANPAGFDAQAGGYQGGGGSGGGGSSSTRSPSGGAYGGGSAGQFTGAMNNNGGGGAVRIIWGSGRAFPSTLTGDV